MTDTFLQIKLADRTISTQLPAFVMGIINCTPDSFFGESRVFAQNAAQKAQKMIEQGADILDIGGESTRPGSNYVEDEEEIKRIIPVIKSIRKINSKIAISVDTRKKRVMEEAWNAGADILNDVSALEDDSGMAQFAADKKIPVILMHKKGIPQTMQNSTEYADVVLEVSTYLENRATYAISCGISPDKIIIDPGIGFGKDLKSNIALIKNCGTLCGKKYPVLMALSRKTCIGEITGKPTEERLIGTVTANIMSVQNGATLLRVHDVAECTDSLKILSALS